MKIYHLISQWQQQRNTLAEEKTLGIVMTMGALHKGHLSLIKQSQKENDLTLVTIFVNPTQFNKQSDFMNYPKTRQQDIELLTMHGVDFLLSPQKEDLYPDHYHYQIQEKLLSQKLCGQSRPGHFEGMLTVVLKLLNIAQATNAYFGEKDYQQLQLIQGMAEAFFIPTNIIGCPTIREEDTLAFSSRNFRLNPVAREKAKFFAQSIRQYQTINTLLPILEQHNIQIDYLEDHDNRRFVAVVIEGVRLIDNFLLFDIPQDKQENV